MSRKNLVQILGRNELHTQESFTELTRDSSSPNTFLQPNQEEFDVELYIDVIAYLESEDVTITLVGKNLLVLAPTFLTKQYTGDDVQ